VLFVGTGDSDTGFGGHGDDRMSGGAGDDALFGYDGDDSMVGGDGADELFSGKGDDIVLGGSSNDRIFADAGNDMLLGGEGNDHLDAGDGNDQIWGDQGRDVVKAGLGNDVIFAMAGDGNDVYDGGDGIDTADYSAIATGIVFDLDAGMAKSVGAGNSGEDVLKDIENIVGGSGNDTFYANNAVNVFEGGGGNDTFVFRTAASANGDRIEGFAAGDVIKLSNIFGEITESTFVDNGTFTAAGQIRLVVANGDTRIEGNIDGDADADFSLTVEDYLVRKDEII
jgi:Ca2+-binding RTX toxin-like protein